MSSYATFAIKRASFVTNIRSKMNSYIVQRSESFFNSSTNSAKFLLSTYLKIACTVALCQERSVKGDVTIGPGNSISPQARFSAEAGPIIIGSGNIIEADVEIANRLRLYGSETRGQAQIVDSGNIFKTGTVCEALRVGSGNILGPRAYIGRNVVLTSGIIVQPGCSLTESGTIAPGTIIGGSRCQRF